MACKYSYNIQSWQYVLGVEWEEPGGSVDLVVKELKQAFQRPIIYCRPWPEAGSPRTI